MAKQQQKKQDNKKQDNKKGGGKATQGLTQAEKRQRAYNIRNARASYSGVLIDWGIPITPELDKFVAQAARKGMSGDAFLNAIRKTKAYARAFPGIMKPNGTMVMSESEYLSGFEQLRDFGATFGRGFTKDMYGMSLKNGNSVAEIKQKFEAVDMMNSNRQILDQFGQYLVEMGLERQPPAREDMLKYVMGTGPKVWEEAWDSAVVATRSKQAGLQMTFGEIKHLVNQIETSGIGDATDITPDVFAKVADNLRHVGVMKQYGIDDKDAILASFGLGPRRQLVEDVLKNVRSFEEGVGRVQQNPFEEARAERFTQGEARRGGASL